MFPRAPTTMNAIVFEDDAVDRLAPLSTARPVCDLTIGCGTLVEALGHFGVVRRAVRPHLTAYLADLAGGRCAFWGASTVAPPPARAASTHGAVLLVVNARVVPGRAAIASRSSSGTASGPGGVGAAMNVGSGPAGRPSSDSKNFLGPPGRGAGGAAHGSDWLTAASPHTAATRQCRARRADRP